MQALLRLYSGSIQALFRHFYGYIKALPMHLWRCQSAHCTTSIGDGGEKACCSRNSAQRGKGQSSKTTVVNQRVGGEKAFCSRNSHLEVRVTNRLKALEVQLLCAHTSAYVSLICQHTSASYVIRQHRLKALEVQLLCAL
jgi:hypothetical protein